MNRLSTFLGFDNMVSISKSIVFVVIVYIFAATLVSYSTVRIWSKDKHNEISRLEKSGISAKDACDISGCVEYSTDGKNILTERGKSYNFFEKFIVGVITEKFKYRNGELILSPYELVYELFKIFLIMLFFVVVGVFIVISNFIIRYTMDRMLMGAGNAADMHNQNMALLAEQVHHEMNTPLTVLKDICEDTFETIEKNSICRFDNKKESPCSKCGIAKQFVKMQNNRRIVALNMSQAFAILDRMVDAKEIRYSNGNKTLYDIARATFDVMSIFTRSSYKFKIDENLRKFKIDHKVGLENYILMNILMNHIKNSIEANADFVGVKIDKEIIVKPNIMQQTAASIINKVSDKGIIGMFITYAISSVVDVNRLSDTMLLRIFVIDNGNGIPDDAVDTIYNLNASTKGEDGDVRGAGLYVSREIIRQSGGDDELIGTSSKGTIFGITIPVSKIV